MRGLDNRVFCMNNEPWKIRKPITKILHEVDENGLTSSKNVSEKCFKFHGRYRVEGESQDLKKLIPENETLRDMTIEHHDSGAPRHMQKQYEDIWFTEHTPSPVMIGSYKQNLLSKTVKGFGWPSTNSDQFYSPKLGISQNQLNKRITALNAKIYWEDWIGSYKINCSRQHEEDSNDLEYEIGQIYDQNLRQEFIDSHIGCPKNHKGETAVLDLYCNGGDRTVNMITGLVPESTNKLEVSTWPIYNSYPSWSCGINGTEAYTNPILAISTVEDELSKNPNQYSKIGHEHLTFTDLSSCQDKYLELAKEQIAQDETGFFMTKNLDKISVQAVILRLMIVFCVCYLVHKLFTSYKTVIGKKNNAMSVKEREAIQHQNGAAGSIQGNIIQSNNFGGSAQATSTSLSLSRTEPCDLTSESGSDQPKM